MSCVNTSSKEFKSLLSKVNVSSGTLELLIHKLQNDNENAPYPTPSEVIAKLSPKAFVSNADMIHAWINNYSKPRYFRTIDEAEFFFMEDAIRIFGKDSVSLTQTKDGGYIAEVGRPDILPFSLNNGIWSELKSTLKEGPKDALLKAFIEVFEINGRLPIVDISPLPNTEYISATGIKTNGVPLALGGRDSIIFDTNALLSLMSKTPPNMREKVFKQYFLHELTHSVTLAAIDKVEAGKGTKEEKAFYDEINRIYNIAKEAMGAEADSYYGMNNIKEFLAEITSNLSFQKRLASIKDTKKKNLWNTIIDAFTSFFNKYFNMDIKDSVLESGLMSLSEYIQYAKNNSTSIEATPTELANKVNSVTPGTFLTFNSLSDLQRFLQNEGFTVGVSNSNRTEAEAHIIGKHKYNGAYWLKQWTDESLTSNTNIAKNLLNKVLSNLGIADKGVITIKDTGNGTIVEFHKEAFDKAKEEILENIQDRDYYENSLLSESEQYDLEVLDSVDSELSSLVKEGKLSIYEAKDLFEQKNGISIYYQSNPDMAFSQAPSDVQYQSNTQNDTNNYSSEEQGIIDKAKKDGTFMKAPNGKHTNLTERQWVQVRTKAFKDWFGDWENNPNEASKVVDENGEPLVVYRMNTEPLVKGKFSKGFTYFTTDLEYAEPYARGSKEATLYSVFLNIKNPLDYRLENYEDYARYAHLVKDGTRVKSEDYEIENKLVAKLQKEGKLEDYDGIVGNDAKNWWAESLGLKATSDGIEYVTFNPNQIKSATDNIGTFSRTDDRIDYFETNNSEKVAESQEALDILKKEGITLDNSLIDKYLLEVKASNPYHQIFKQIVEILNNNNIPINIVVNSNLSNIAARKQDGFKTATIEINPALLLDYLMTDNKDNIKENLMKVLTHELVHAVTAEILNYHPSWAKIKNFNEAQTEFSNNVWNLYLQCKEQLKGTEWYGLTNAKEFIAVALTDRDFQIELSKIKLNKNENAFKRFINYLTDLFNKVFKAQGIDIKNSALEEIISISQEYFNSANKNLRGGIYDYTGTRDYYNNAEAPQTDKTEKEQDLYTTKQQDKMQQIDNLLGDNLLSATEVRHIAEQAVYWISDHITELQENPELAKTIYGDRFKNEDDTDKDFASMTRADVVRTIGVDNIIEMCKQKFSPEHNDFDNDDTLDKAFAITDNWQAIMLLAQDSFLNVEDFSIVSTPDGKANEVNEDLVGDADNFNESNDQLDVEEIEGSLQEHWQIESRCQDVLGTMSQMVKRALLKCYILDKDGNNVQSEFGINERINVREATNSILRWTQGSLSLADMVTKLQEKQEDNPWVKQLINRLSDTSGKETDFQGQFYGTFSKHFQPYSVVIEEDGKYKSIQVNENPALSEAMTQVTTQYKIGEHPLFTTDGINKESFKELRAAYDSLEKFRHMGYDLSNEVNKDEAANILGYISNLFGYYVTPDMVKSNLTKENYKKMYSALGYIIKSFENNLDNASYEPFKFKAKDSINGNMREFLKPITEQLEDIAVSSFYDSGKMYQSYVTPSYMSKLMQKFSQKGEAFDKFLTEEFGNQPWFHEGTDIERSWRNSWLRALATDSKAREIFKHKVQLNFNKHNYMKNMSDMEYTLSLFTEYFSEGANDKQSRVPAWFRVPMLSNKPSSEFIRFYSERGTNYRETITDGMMDIFNQELSRIQTVLMRNLDSKDPRFIKNFDKNGKKFCFLDFMNDYLTGDKKNSELGKLINDKVNGKEVDEAKLYELANKAIFNTMDARAKTIVERWIDSGLMEGAKKITGIGVTEEEIKSNLENFVWNDTFAAMNIMELTVTDIAYYKNAEDLQKRLAQIHAPGIRGNIEATDYEGRKVSDGKERTFYLTDWDNFVSNIIDNVSIVFDRKIAEAPEAEKAGYRALKKSLVGENGAFRNINVADAQGYSSPTSYRKKAFIFGKWSKKAEDIYQKLRKGDYNYSDLSIAFQPLKPFVYSQIEKSSGVPNAPLDKFKVPVQNKNSEYLLIMADAILQNENTGRPNLLRAIYEVMEESHYDEDDNYKTDGIDTVQFESTVKSGLMGRINLNKYVNDANGEAKAKAVMKACLYETTSKTVQEVNPETGELEDIVINTKTGKYSQTYVHELPFEDYCLQQEVPEHFKNHEQVHGSQLRYIVVSELATKDSFGNDATYEVEGRKVSADEFKAEYEQTIADNIEDSINELESALALHSTNARDRNIALSKILQREILSSPRYGVDLLQACSVDENGRFRIPLGDPIQSKRVEQLINSIIKNRINKQEIAGGPVVQVTNFGTSRELNIRFKDKNGGLLKTRAEYEKNPIKKELSQTDKFNAKYKGLKTSESIMSYKDYIKENQGGIAYFEVFAPIYANNLFSQFADKNGNISIEALEALDPDLLKMIGYRIPTEAKYSMAPLKIVGFLPREAGDGIMLPNDITLLTGSDFDVDKEYLMRKDYNISRNKITKSALHKILYDSLIESQKSELSYGAKSKLNSLVRQFLEDPFDRTSLVNQKTADGFMSIPSSSYSKLLKLYLQNAFTVEKPTEGRIYRNNKIVDMTYEVLTHETSCAEMLNPGGFDPQKRMGYLVTALRTTNKSYEELSKMSIDELKDLSDKDKNLMFVDTHVQFYKQNSAAGSLIGIFAVNRTAHAVIENEGYMINVDNACRLTRPFTVADMTFGGNMPIDVRFDNNGQSVGKVLGSLVASAADAVKDPVLNLMNINSNTANILNTLVRLGMPFDDAALFLSQRAISSVLNQFSSENITGFTSLSKIVEDRIKRIEKDLNIDENSSLNEEELTREQLIEGVKSSDSRIEYKVLKSFRNFQRLADAMRMPTFATRFNSISSAVGPLIIDNLITEHKMEKLSSESNILDSNGEEISINDIFIAHPILNQFRRTLGIAQGLFGNMPANSTGFRNILTYASENPIGDAILSDRKILSSLSDFYQSYLVVAGNVVNSSDLSKVISEFPKEFMEKNYKKQYNNNLLIQSIKYGTDKGGRATIQIDITGLDTQQKERLSSAWIDLHKVNPELSEQLFKYCFFRAGIGFSPKTFMSLVPVYVKERLNSYVNTFRVLPSSTPEIVLDQFIRNNWDNNRLVPRKKNVVMSHLENGNFEVYKENDVKELQKTQYFKMKVDNVDKLYQQVLLKDDSIEYKEVSPLGSNKDYLEVSADGINKPIEIPSTSLEDNEKSEISSSIDGEAKSDESTSSKQEQIDLLHLIYMTKGKTFADAEKTIQNYKGMDNEFKKAIESQVKKFMKSRLKTLGVKFDEKTIEEEYKKLC